jgi:hypothetical protein
VEEAWQFGVHEEQIELSIQLDKEHLLAMELGGMLEERFCQFS